MADIFITHSSRDNETAAAIGERIRRERPTWSLFYDRDNIRAGQRWQQRLREELQSARVVLAVLSRDWVASPWCFAEAVTAAFRGKDFVGIEIENLSPEDLGRAPPIVGEHQRVRVRDGNDPAWQQVLEALDRSGLDPDDWFQITPEVGPYPGLVAFDEKNAGVFFGRKQEITDYLALLDTLRAPDRSQVLVISGGSGNGKSSLLRAGLLPRLRRKREWCVIIPFEVAREPVRNLLASLAEALASWSIRLDGLDLVTMPPDPQRLADTLDEATWRLERGTNAWVLLPLDQAEALLTENQPSEEAALLLQALIQLLAKRTRRLVVATTIRTEFVPRLEGMLGSEQVRLYHAPLGPIRGLGEVIEKPAERFGIALEPGLSSQIVEDVRSPDALPLLAYTLSQLYEQYGGDRELTLDEYHKLGGVHGAIGTKLAQVLTDPTPTVGEFAALRRVFNRHLIWVDESAVEGERYLRRVASRVSLPQAASRVLNRFIEARLLIARKDTIELSHERLIDDWPFLPIKTWLIQDAAERGLINRLRQRIGEEVLSDSLLAQAEEMLQHDDQLRHEEPNIVALVERSRHAKEASERRRRWILITAITTAIIFAAVTVFAGLQWIRAERQTTIAERQTAVATTERDKALESNNLTR